MKDDQLMRTVQNFFDAMNSHDVEKMSSFCTNDVVAHEVAEKTPFNGIEAFKNSYKDVFEGYPDCHVTVLNEYQDEGNLIYEVKWQATNSGVFRGIDPTNREVELQIAYFFRFNNNSKIEHITEYYDVGTLLEQQGQL